jgi:hypothetical protein
MKSKYSDSIDRAITSVTVVNQSFCYPISRLWNVSRGVTRLQCLRGRERGVDITKQQETRRKNKNQRDKMSQGKWRWLSCSWCWSVARVPGVERHQQEGGANVGKRSHVMSPMDTSVAMVTPEIASSGSSLKRAAMGGTEGLSEDNTRRNASLCVLSICLRQTISVKVSSEVSTTAVTTKNTVLWDINTRFVPHRRQYLSATESNLLRLCKIWGFRGGDYEECRLLRYRNPVHTSQETHYLSATESNRLVLCKIWGFHGGDYEECRLLGYKILVRASQETHYVFATEFSQLMLCKIRGFHGGDYVECRLLGYKNPVRTSQETHYVSTTEPSQLMLCKIWGFHGGDYEECRPLPYKNQFVSHRRHITSPLQNAPG